MEVMGKTNGWVDFFCVYSNHGKLCFVKISIRLRKKAAHTLKSLLKKKLLFKYHFRSYQKFIWNKIILLVWKQLGILTVQGKNLSGVGGVNTALSLTKISVLNAITIYDM